MSLLVLGALFAAGCSDGKAAATAQGEITVFAATSLTGAFNELTERFEQVHDDAKVTLNFAASSALVQQLREGADADVVALADRATMETLRADRLVRAPVVIARNRMVIVTKPGNPTEIRSLADLARLDVVSLCGAEVPCGAYAASALRKAGVSLDASKITRGQNASAALAAVTEGDAAAAVVYATDARAAGARVSTVPIPERHNVVAAYPIATGVGRRNTAGARAFVAFVISPAGRHVLRAYGFLRA
ncbi:MAG TPA: molybdate ABC transporter substrate-binding protein [Acidimicrobiales bacterium]|nr:molybdate ABC transporter substrate-binding protein [Acidimicrobiales bacterium]